MTGEAQRAQRAGPLLDEDARSIAPMKNAWSSENGERATAEADEGRGKVESDSVVEVIGATVEDVESDAITPWCEMPSDNSLAQPSESDFDRQKSPASHDSYHSESNGSGPLEKQCSGNEESKKEKYRMATKKLMTGVLDDVQKQAIRGSEICVTPNSLRGRCRRLVHANSFTYAVSVVVVVNAVFIGFETEFQRCSDSVSSSAWYGVQVVFSLTFLAELGIRFFAERSSFWHDLWNIFDTVLVLASVSDTLILHHVMRGGALDLMVALRISRLARLVRIFRLLRFFKELWFLVAGIFDGMRTLAWAWLLISFMTYIPAIFATRMFGNSHKDDEFLQEQFGTIPRSMYTLFTVLTLEGWSDIARHTMKVEGWSWLFFIAFIFATTFAIMNVVVAVIVQNTLEHASHCKDEELQAKRQYEQQVMDKIMQVFEAADADGDGDLTRDEFLQSLDNAKVARYLHEIGVDVRQAETLFEVLDYDESGCLDLCEFIEGVLRARGEAKAKDVLAVQCDVWRVESRLLDEVEEFEQAVRLKLNSAEDMIERFRRDAGCLDLSLVKSPSRRSNQNDRTITLRITIVGARGLRDADWVTKSDPYCICEVLGKPDLTFRTATIKDELKPSWQHTSEISGFLSNDTLVFAVMDEDVWPKADDFLGRGILNSEKFYPDGFDGELTLQDESGKRGRSGRLKVIIVVLTNTEGT
jgi:voltage-gated sodium channel